MKKKKFYVHSTFMNGNINETFKKSKQTGLSKKLQTLKVLMKVDNETSNTTYSTAISFI